MKVHRLLFLITISLGFSCCKSHIPKVSEPQNFSELVKYAYYLRNDNNKFVEVSKLLNDTIVNSKTPFYLYTLTEINKIDKTISWVFHEKEKNILRVSDRLIFRICIKDSSSLYINHLKCDLSEIKNMASQYIYYPNGIDKDIIHYKINAEYIGTVEISRVEVHLCCDVQKNSGLSVNEWKLFFDCIHELILVFEEQKDKLAIEKFGQKYEFLPFEKKSIFADVVGYPLIIDFFDECHDWESHALIN